MSDVFKKAEIKFTGADAVNLRNAYERIVEATWSNGTYPIKTQHYATSTSGSYVMNSDGTVSKKETPQVEDKIDAVPENALDLSKVYVTRLGFAVSGLERINSSLYGTMEGETRKRRWGLDGSFTHDFNGAKSDELSLVTKEGFQEIYRKGQISEDEEL